jgi:hypothetical protein
MNAYINLIIGFILVSFLYKKMEQILDSENRKEGLSYSTLQRRYTENKKPIRLL